MKNMKILSGALGLTMSCSVLFAGQFEEDINSSMRNLESIKLEMDVPLEVALDVYDFPVKTGTEEWKAFKNHKEMLKACQIPDTVLQKISTKGLLETVLNYPLFWDIFAYSGNFQQKFEKMSAKFNGIQELFKRKDIGTELLKKYRYMNPAGFEKDSSDEEIGEYLFNFYEVEILLAQNDFRANLTEAQLVELKKEILAKDEIKKQIEYYDGGLGKTVSSLLFEGTSNKVKSVYDVGPLIHTPNKTPVETWKLDPSTDYNRWEAVACNRKVEAEFPDAIRETWCTRKYNCHSYAWYNQSEPNLVWIEKPEQNKYWADRSYVRWYGDNVISGMKLDYFSADHSAIFVSGSNPSLYPMKSYCRS
ncbi:MAG: hypothetical protein U9Q34_03295, partial [Elusimicrobiota bacterium]|nr:hypothetical protein [Elusimicrobiota bacterium]